MAEFLRKERAKGVFKGISSISVARRVNVCTLEKDLLPRFSRLVQQLLTQNRLHCIFSLFVAGDSLTYSVMLSLANAPHSIIVLHLVNSNVQQYLMFPLL